MTTCMGGAERRIWVCAALTEAKGHCSGVKSVDCDKEENDGRARLPVRIGWRFRHASISRGRGFCIGIAFVK